MFRRKAYKSKEGEIVGNEKWVKDVKLRICNKSANSSDYGKHKRTITVRPLGEHYFIQVHRKHNTVSKSKFVSMPYYILCQMGLAAGFTPSRFTPGNTYVYFFLPFPLHEYLYSSWR
jgi:hypothetical protein